MPYYQATELTDNQREVWSAITAIQACYEEPTIDRIAEFTKLSQKTVKATILELKSVELVQQRSQRGRR